MQDERQNDRLSQPLQQLPVIAETLRSTGGAMAAPTPSKGEDRIPLFWRVFGGTLLSIAALAIISVCQHFNNSLDELRTDLGHKHSEVQKELSHLSEAQAGFLKQDEFNYRMKSAWDSLKTVQADLASVAVLKEKAGFLEGRVKVEADELQQLSRELQRLSQVKAAEDERKELVRELQLMRERLAVLEGRQSTAPAVKTAVHKQE
jgi:hypothetical protein